MPRTTALLSSSPNCTRTLGERLGRLLQPGDIVTLAGELGAGKTALAQGIALGLDVEEPVSSPTFALVHQYVGRAPVRHLDVYRLSGPAELHDLGWTEMLDGRGVILLEWPERVMSELPGERLDIRLDYAEGDTRRIEITPHGARAEALLDALESSEPAQC